MESGESVFFNQMEIDWETKIKRKSGYNSSWSEASAVWLCPNLLPTVIKMKHCDSAPCSRALTLLSTMAPMLIFTAKPISRSSDWHFPLSALSSSHFQQLHTLPHRLLTLLCPQFPPLVPLLSLFSGSFFPRRKCWIFSRSSQLLQGGGNVTNTSPSKTGLGSFFSVFPQYIPSFLKSPGLRGVSRISLPHHKQSSCSPV